MRVKTEDRRRAIMRAALCVFREVGYERASMSEIAARLGGSKATLYGYFKSKEELFASAMVEEVSDKARLMHETLEPDTDDLEATLEIFGRAYLDFVCSSELVDKRRTILAKGAASTLGPLIYEMGPQRTRERVAAFMARRIGEGALRRADPTIAALHFLGLLEAGVVEPPLYGARPALTIEAAVPLAVEAFLMIYGPRARPKAPADRPTGHAPAESKAG
jgi:AcrR family transcriptional regulator